jgi:hypothetical protein
MNHLSKIAKTAAPSTGVQFRRKEYENGEIRSFLKDVTAMANAAVRGSRYIVVGMEVDSNGKKRLHSVPETNFSGKPSYQSLVMDFIEPPVRIRYQPVMVGEKRLGVFEIPDCQDRPYMMRIDHSETLRRGDAYVRVKNGAIKLGRKQLQSMFEKKFHESVSEKRIEIGFPGEIIHKDLKIKTVDLAELPSAVARVKLEQLLNVSTSAKKAGSTTVMSRLMHARLFGSDSPYESKSPAQLMEEMAQLDQIHFDDDNVFLFEENAEMLQFVIFNQGEEPIQDASLSLVMPNHSAFHVAHQLPRLAQDDRYVERSASEAANYPGVSVNDDTVHVSNSLGEIPCGEHINAFKIPLRVCVGSDLKKRKLGIRYALSGANLRQPAQGTLRLLF